MARLAGVVLLLFAAASAVPAPGSPDPVIYKRSSDLRYQYREDDDGQAHLVDQWYKVSDAQVATRYNPDLQNVYHLFTRTNPSVSQPFLLGRNDQLAATSFDPRRRTVFIIHGWTQSATSNVNTVIVPAYMAAYDCNVIVVDWSSGASVLDLNGPTNAVDSGYSVARTIDWLVTQTGVSVSDMHLIGFSLGAHQAAVAARHCNGNVPYVTALDPGANMEDSGHIFGPDAGIYTEAIHTNADIMGHGSPVADVDFYPNGGDYQPGCGIVNFLCNHYRSFFYFAETLTTNTGFIGARCQSYAQARLGLCLSITGTLRMGGIFPKTGSSGIFHLTTNEDSPFGQ